MVERFRAAVATSTVNNSRQLYRNDGQKRDCDVTVPFLILGINIPNTTLQLRYAPLPYRVRCQREENLEQFQNRFACPGK